MLFFKEILVTVQYGLSLLLYDVPDVFLTNTLQAENLADFYEYCKGLELARNFQFPILRQVPFLSKSKPYIMNGRISQSFLL